MTGTAASDELTYMREDDRRSWRRHPGDVARLVWRALALAAILAVTALAPTALSEVSADLVHLFAQTPPLLRDALVGLSQLVAFGVPLAVLAWLATRRTYGEAGLVVGAAVAAGVVMALLIDWLDRAAPPQDIADLPSGWVVGGNFPSATYVAALVGGAAAASPLMDQAWRRVAYTGVVTAVLVRLLTATQAPVNLAVTVALGGVIGSAVLVAVGSPRRRPGAASLRAALATTGLEIDNLRDESSHTGRRTYLGTSAGTQIRVAFVDRDDRDADALARFLRAIRVHSVDEENYATRPRQRVEHEALVTLMAQQAGAAVPDVYAAVPTERESAVLALGVHHGQPLASLSGDDVSEAALEQMWGQVELLHQARISHRDLTGLNIIVDSDSVSLSGLANARLAASDDQLSVDIAELLVTSALTVGPDRAIAAAVRSFSGDAIERALPFVQSAALPMATRKAAKSQKGIVAEVRAGVERALNLEEVELEQLTRISIVRVVTWVGFGVLAFFLLALVSSWPAISEKMQGLNWWWALPIGIATICGTVGGAMSLIGSVTRRVPLGEATWVMFGQSFLNRFTPVNSGGMAMRIRYLQKGGTDGTVAAAAIGLTSAASGLLQGIFLLFFFVWSGSDPTEGVGSDDSGGASSTNPIIAVVVLAVVAAILTLVLSPKVRGWTINFVKSSYRKIRGDFGELAQSPAKLAWLFGGAGFAKLATILAFVFACRAFQIDLSFATLGALYLGASVVASTVPTPGGVGAIEAALVLVLSNAGVDEATAWAAVMLFRLINFWLPTIPGYFALKVCERREFV